MPDPMEAFEEALSALEAGRPDAALQAVASLDHEPTSPWRAAAGALRALAHSIAGRWQQALDALKAPDGAHEPGLDSVDGPLVPALRSVASACLEPSEDALHAGLHALFAPRRPLPLLARPGLAELSRLHRQGGARLVEDAALGRRHAEQPAGGEPAVATASEEPDPLAGNPVLAACLALAWPEPDGAHRRLARAVAAGLDVPALRLALARLRRLAGDPEAAQQELAAIDPATLDGQLSTWLAREQSLLAESSLHPPEGERLEALVLLPKPEHQQGPVRLRLVHGLYLVAETLRTGATPNVDTNARAEASAEAGTDPADGADVLGRWVSVPRMPAQALRRLAGDFLDAGFSVDPETVRLGPAPPSLWSLQPPREARKAAGPSGPDAPPPEQALALGQGLIRDFPDDAPLLDQVVELSWQIRGAAATVPLAQQRLALFGETPEGLERLAVLLYEAGWTEESVGVLLHLERSHGMGALSPQAWALLVEAHVLPRLAPGIAQELLEHAERLHPDAAPVAEARARLAFWQGKHNDALDSLLPLLAAPHVPLRRAALALQVHLEGEIPGADTLLRAAESCYAREALISAARHELEGHATAALKAYRAAAKGAAPSEALECQLYAMRAACRLSQFEEGLRIARSLQTRMEAPDPRCLATIHQCLTALEPAEQRDDLAEMIEEARRRAHQAGLTAQVQRQSILSAGLYLDPDLLAPLWSEATAGHGSLDPEAAPAPRLADAVVACATGTGAVVLCDPLHVAQSASELDSASWLGDAEAVTARLEAGALALAPSATAGAPLWVRITTAPIPELDLGLYAETYQGTLLVPSGQIYLGPAEVLVAHLDEENDPLALGFELGGRTRWVPPGRYGVRIYLRTDAPWPDAPTTAEPCDVIFRLETAQP